MSPFTPKREELAQGVIVGDVGDLVFIDLGGPWVELSEIGAFWPVEAGSMVMVQGVALPCSCTTQEIVDKMKQVLLQTQR